MGGGSRWPERLWGRRSADLRSSADPRSIADLRSAELVRSADLRSAESRSADLMRRRRPRKSGPRMGWRGRRGISVLMRERV